MSLAFSLKLPYLFDIYFIARKLQGYTFCPLSILLHFGCNKYDDFLAFGFVFSPPGKPSNIGKFAYTQIKIRFIIIITFIIMEDLITCSKSVQVLWAKTVHRTKIWRFVEWNHTNTENIRQKARMHLAQKQGQVD